MAQMPVDSGTAPGLLARIWSRPQWRMALLISVSGLMSVVAVSAILLLHSDYGDMEHWRSLGYPGVLLFSFLGSAAMAPLVPGVVVLCGVSPVLNPLILAVLNAVGESAGETAGYAVGYGGGPVLEKRRFYVRARRWMERRGVVTLFIVSVIPNPFFDLVGIAAGGVRFPLVKFLLSVFAGKLVKGIAVAYACYYGVELGMSLLHWFE